MTAIHPGSFLLQAHIALNRLGVNSVVVSILLLFGAATWIGYALNLPDQERQEQDLAQIRQALQAPAVENPGGNEQSAERSLRIFYATLGDRLDTETYLKRMFMIAAQSGLELDQGEYQWKAESNSGTFRYQVLLPVKGSYGAIRQFCEKTLLALPFVSLDEMSFNRESVGDDELGASLRFTLYLKDALVVPRQTGPAR